MSNITNNNSIHPLHVVVYCGPNGSGKTTMMDGLKAEGLTVQGQVLFPPSDEINPDRVAKTLTHLPEGKVREAAAQRKAWEMREEFLAGRKPFSFETVMSHPSRIGELQKLKQANYQIFLTFITTNDPQKNVARVAQRVKTGSTTGHDVPVDKILSRYERTLDLLSKAVEIADASYIYDNSYDGKLPTLQLVFNNTPEGVLIEDVEQPEPWVEIRLLKPLRDRSNELRILEQQAAKHGYQLRYPDELVGEYSGEIAFETAYFLVVREEEKILSAHDKLMFPQINKQKYVIGTQCRIRYDYKTESKIELT